MPIDLNKLSVILLYWIVFHAYGRIVIIIQQHSVTPVDFKNNKYDYIAQSTYIFQCHSFELYSGSVLDPETSCFFALSCYQIIIQKVQ